MKVNDDKLQYIVFCRKEQKIVKQVGNNEIKSSSYVKLLGVYFDQKLISDHHVDELLGKARRKLPRSVLARLTKTLDVQS